MTKHDSVDDARKNLSFAQSMIDEDVSQRSPMVKGFSRALRQDGPADGELSLLDSPYHDFRRDEESSGIVSGAHAVARETNSDIDYFEFTKSAVKLQQGVSQRDV